MTTPAAAARRIPRTCVWELTLACNARCLHCGSQAGRARRAELDSPSALSLVEQLAALGCESVTLSGGEPLCRADWPIIARAVTAAGMRAELISNGLLAAAQAEAIAGAGFYGVTLSVDGPARVHDELRGVAGALAQLLAGAAELRRRGVRLGAVTQVNQRNLPHLAEVHELLLDHGFEGWQVQLTMAHGRALGQADLCLRPEQLPALEESLLGLEEHPCALFMQAADNIGYMSRHEPRLRSGTGRADRFWAGCAAGLSVVGITSDGTVRGCLSLPPSLDEGRLAERSLAAIWNDPEAFAYNRRFRPEDLSGACGSCVFGRICRGGCHSLAVAATGSHRSNPYCLWRLQQEQEPAP